MQIPCDDVDRGMGHKILNFYSYKDIYYHLVTVIHLVKNLIPNNCSQFICSYTDVFTVFEVKWRRNNDIIHLKKFRKINVPYTFIHKI